MPQVQFIFMNIGWDEVVRYAGVGAAHSGGQVYCLLLHTDGPVCGEEWVMQTLSQIRMVDGVRTGVDGFTVYLHIRPSLLWRAS